MKDALSHMQEVHVLGKATSFNRPLDRSVLEGFKTAVSKQCSGHFASAILKGLQEGRALDFDFSRLALKDLVVGFVTQAFNDVQTRERFFHIGWGTSSCRESRTFCTDLCWPLLHHTEGTFFRKTRKGVVLEQAFAEG